MSHRNRFWIPILIIACLGPSAEAKKEKTKDLGTFRAKLTGAANQLKADEVGCQENEKAFREGVNQGIQGDKLLPGIWDVLKKSDNSINQLGLNLDMDETTLKITKIGDPSPLLMCQTGEENKKCCILGAQKGLALIHQANADEHSKDTFEKNCADAIATGKDLANTICAGNKMCPIFRHTREKAVLGCLSVGFLAASSKCTNFPTPPASSNTADGMPIAAQQKAKVTQTDSSAATTPNERQTDASATVAK